MASPMPLTTVPVRAMMLRQSVYGQTKKAVACEE